MGYIPAAQVAESGLENTEGTVGADSRSGGVLRLRECVVF